MMQRTMTDDTPPDWVLLEAAKRSGMVVDRSGTVYLNNIRKCDKTFRALCDMIQKYEQPPVDRKLLCAREAYARWTESDVNLIGIRAIELWEEGFGRD